MALPISSASWPSWFYARALIATKRLWGGPALLTVVDFDDFVIWITLGIILGGRLGYVLFYNFEPLRRSPARSLRILGRRHVVPRGAHRLQGRHRGVRAAPRHADAFAPTCSPPAAPSACSSAASPTSSTASSRAARPTCRGASSSPTGGPIPRHPSQLYEAALEGLVLFALLAVLVWLGGLKRPGLVTGAFAVGYGVARIVCELFREPDAQLGFLWGGLTMGMLLCIPVILAGAALIGLALRREPIAKNG